MMGEEFYASIKLISGEEILSLICIDENDGDPIILAQNPVIMKIVNNRTGSLIKVRPWMEIPDDDIFAIKLDRIITLSEVKNKKIINVYNSYIEGLDEEDNFSSSQPSGKVSISNKMGYISSVADARKALEELYKNSKES